MTAPSAVATAAPLRLMLVDEDPVFRLGLRIWLEQSADYVVVAEAAQGSEALAQLATLASAGVDLVILDLGLGLGQPDQIPGLRLCADLKTRYPGLPVLVLSAQAEPVVEAAARRLGADGVGARAMAVADLDRLIRRLARPGGAAPLTPPRPPVLRERGVPQPPPRGLVGLRYGLRQSSVRQIDAAIAAIEAEQRRGRSSLLAEAVLAGRYRELRAARWLMERLLATPTLAGANLAGDRERPAPGAAAGPGRQEPRPPAPAICDRPDPALVVTASTPPPPLANQVFEGLFGKLQGTLDNTSGVPLETDILRADKKRELFYLALCKVEDALAQLRQANIPPGQLGEKSPLVLRDLWEATLSDFLGRYYTLQVDNLEQPVVPTLLAEAPVVQAAILDRIPLVPMLLGHLLYGEAMVVDGGLYPATAPAALERSQALLEHLLIQLANGVVQPLLNHFADVELLKKSLYQRRMLTSRDIERFRNDLSWRYRWDGLVTEPRAIFESQHRLFGFTERGIQAQAIYAPRRDELDRLSGVQRAVTLVVEVRDAVAPRFRSAVALVGSGLVYVLTDVIGRGIGLIGRGILRGVGGGWRDPRGSGGVPDNDLYD